MNKIDLNKLKEAIDKDESFGEICTWIEEDDDEMYLALSCMSSVSDDYETFAEVYADGLLTMIYGGVNVLDIMSGIDEYYDPTTGGILPEFDTYENLVDIIVSSIKQDVADEEDFLNDVRYTLGLEMED